MLRPVAVRQRIVAAMVAVLRPVRLPPPTALRPRIADPVLVVPQLVPLRLPIAVRPVLRLVRLPPRTVLRLVRLPPPTVAQAVLLVVRLPLPTAARLVLRPVRLPPLTVAPVVPQDVQLPLPPVPQLVLLLPPRTAARPRAVVRRVASRDFTVSSASTARVLAVQQRVPQPVAHRPVPLRRPTAVPPSAAMPTPARSLS